MDIEAKVALFRDMIECCRNLYLWAYDSGFHLISSNCPECAMLNELFIMSNRKEGFNEELAKHNTPILFTNDIGLMWVMIPHMEKGELIRLYVLGPSLIDDLSVQSMEAQLREYDLAFPLRHEFLKFIQTLPVITLSHIIEYAIMLYFCITGEKITVSDLRYHKSNKPAADFPQPELVDFHGTYRGEQEMLRMVREGDLNYQAHMDKLFMTGRQGKMSNGHPLRQVKNTVLAGITLFARAAMEGGLSPEVSYTLADYYFQSVETCTSVADLVELARTMENDYIQRVHRCRTGGLSRPIQVCCEYIGLHLEDKLTLSQLASEAGYSESYLGKRFKQELDMSPNEYIRRQRLERAALLLRTTQDDVQEISARLQFCSQSYFANHFRKLFGISPMIYRNKRES